ncbi:MAG: DUF2997 domain-containing protein [Candidatus Nanopelagicaceae bacterium]|nr:DUF2997 domain-containing protein [Candidatus Nanopelagicaceae bacterium]
MDRIIVDVSPTGDVTIKPDGIKGARCKDLTKKLRESLGKTVKDVNTGDFYAAEQGQGVNLGR